MEDELKIELRRSAVYIYGYTPNMSPTLEKSLSIFDYIEKRVTHVGYFYDTKLRIMKIPSGVGLNFVLGKLVADGIYTKNIIDTSDQHVESRRIKGVTCTAAPRDKVQKESVDFIVGLGSADKCKSHRLLTLDTGFGKTVCAIMGSTALQMPTLVTSTNLSNQWVDRILSFTDCTLGENLFYIKTWQDMKKLMDDSDSPMGAYYVIALDSLIAGLKHDTEILNRFYKRFGIGLQIFDECHSHFMKIIRILVNSSVERTLFLSATPTRSDYRQDSLYKKIFRENFRSFGEKTHEINKFNIIMMKYYTTPTRMDLFRIQPRRGVHALLYFKYIFRSESRTRLFVNVLAYFIKKIFRQYSYNPSKKVLIYIQYLEGINIVKDALNKIINTSDYFEGFRPTIGDTSGNVAKEKRHEELNRNIIFATISNREGLDVENLVMIINAIPISSEQIVRQMRGRIRDPKGWFVDLTDGAFEGMKRQTDKRLLNHEKHKNQILHYECKSDGRIEKVFS